eukprot:snap_masked-scaffold_37-processed-gene-2.71-mRNA-1 protein AED:1.00 eAED:1.00 QI:0/0/0/0/1/1/2/0/62
MTEICVVKSNKTTKFIYLISNYYKLVLSKSQVHFSLWSHAKLSPITIADINREVLAVYFNQD